MTCQLYFIFSSFVINITIEVLIANCIYFRSKKSYSQRPTSDEILGLQKDYLRQCIKLDINLHELRIKHENERHRAELEVISAQLEYWKKK